VKKRSDGAGRLAEWAGEIRKGRGGWRSWRVKFGQGGSKTLLGEFGGDEAVEISERAEAGEFFGREGQLERLLDEDHELGEREGIEAEVGGEADFLGGHLESRAERATPAGLTVKVAGALVTLPTELVISTV
jgi:hypothetical protein